MTKVLFVCVENAGRSQMAEAFANHYGKGKLSAQSAGVRLAERINPIAVAVMKEKGIDMSKNKPKLLTSQMTKESDLIFTMGCAVAELCPGSLLKGSVDWELEDPKGKPIEKVREIRDEIESRVLRLIEKI
jgi:arsenate reductase